MIDHAENRHSPGCGMTNDTMRDIAKLEDDLWEAAELAAMIGEDSEELGG